MNDIIDEQLRDLFDYYRVVPTERAVKGYREALADVDQSRLTAACRRARKELEHMPTAAALRRFARDVITQGGTSELSCHFHSDDDGRYRDRPSQESYHWCARCRVFIRQGTQGPDDGKHPQSGTRKLLEAMRADLGIQVKNPAEGIQAFLGQVMEREPGSDDMEPGELF